jgi:hypothetical protein
MPPTREHWLFPTDAYVQFPNDARGILVTLDRPWKVCWNVEAVGQRKWTGNFSIS